MRIAGIGTDLVEIARIEAALARHGERLGRRLLNAREFEQWQQRALSARFLAKRFAVKEAAAKALGTGFACGIRWADIETVHDELGRPQLRFHAAASQRCRQLQVAQSEVSISDERHYALAFVILVRD